VAALESIDATPVRAVIARWRWLKAPALVFVASRVAILFVTHWSLRLDPRLHQPDRLLAYPAVQSLCRWDCIWFATISTHGYSDEQSTNFFPLFPLLGRGLYEASSIPLDICFVLVANAFALVGLAAVYRIFADREGEDVARTGLALLVAWPFAFYQASGYPESLMLASSALAILWTLRGEHVKAGIAFGIGLLARHLVIFTGGALLVALLLERGPRLRKILTSRAFLGLLVAAAIAALYPLFLAFRFGDPLIWLKARTAGWGRAAWFGIVWFVRTRAWKTQPLYTGYVWLSVIPGIGALWLLRDRRHWVLAGYAAPLMLCLWLVGIAGLGRYTQAVWPAFLPLAIALCRHPDWKLPVVLAFAMVQTMYLFLAVHVFPIV